jgi:protein SCO1/2
MSDRGAPWRLLFAGGVLLVLLAGRLGCAGGWAGRSGLVRGESGESSGGFTVHEDEAASQVRRATGASLTAMPWRFVDVNGDTVTLAGRRGRPFVASLVYTRCPTVCPRVTSVLARLQRDAGGEVPVVLISLDPAHDTPETWRAFARTHALDLTRWTLLTPEVGALPAIAAAMGVAWQGTAEGGIAHSAVVALVDSTGRVADQRMALGDDPKGLLAAWRAVAR